MRWLFLAALISAFGFWFDDWTTRKALAVGATEENPWMLGPWGWVARIGGVAACAFAAYKYPAAGMFLAAIVCGVRIVVGLHNLDIAKLMKQKP